MVCPLLRCRPSPLQGLQVYFYEMAKEKLNV